ncbi:MAG: hypothetical protein EZS28_001734 [Streblomastix strix]|uniref:Uncharacterized protein n=1 Tax=Streblomastix strix TaxID=222440 RepID=A0A5J4X6T1_9EUKA|nr:MAG: hypothetical protein EZS28_001734 [Streblomastix strix]
MVLEHGLPRIAILDSLQRYYRVPAHRHRVQLQVSMTRTRVSMLNRKRGANEQKGLFLSHRAALLAQGPEDITRHALESASAGDTVFQSRTQANLVALDHYEETHTIIDITITNIATEIANFGKKWSRQWEYIELPSSTRTRWNRETPGEGQQNKTDRDMRICGPPQNQRKYNQMKHLMPTLTVQQQLHSQRARQQQRFIPLYPTNHLPDI